MKCAILLHLSTAIFLSALSQVSFAVALSEHRFRGSFLQSRSTRWATCTSCHTSSPTSMEQVKLEVLELKDKVDFQLANFGNILREFCSKISNDIDTNYLQELQKSCEGIDEKIQEVNATIKEDYSTYAESLAGDDLTEVRNVDNKCRDIRKRVEKFVLDGLDSFREIFTNLSNEFKMQTNKDIKESANFIEMVHKTRKLSKADDDHDESESITRPDPKATLSTRNMPEKSNDDKEDHSEEDVEVISVPLKRAKHAEGEAKHQERQKETSSKDENDNKSKNTKDGEDANEAMNNAGRFQINLEGVPPSAIVRVMDSFKTDLSVESEKFLAKVLLQPKA